MACLLRGGAPSSVGALRVRSCRFFDTACSRNDDFPFVLRRLFEKLSVCDLLTFRPNIFGVGRKGVVKFEVEDRESHQDHRKSLSESFCREFVEFVECVELAYY
jgi:hypothetical protein